MGTTYYVDATNGKDENSGLFVHEAWATLEKLENQVFEPGDRILLKCGEVWHEGLKLHGQGQPNNPIYLGSYSLDGDNIKVGEGFKPRIYADGQRLYAVYLHNVSFWEIENIEVSNRGQKPEEGRTGIMVSADEHFQRIDSHYVEHIYLKNVFVHNVNGEPTIKDSHNGGIFYSILSEDTENYLVFKDIRIENCYVKDVSRTGISFGNTMCTPEILGEDLSQWSAEEIKPYLHQDVIIRNNYVERSGGDAIVPMYAFRPIIENNTSQEASYSTIDHPELMFNAAIWPWQCYEAVFRYNEAFKTYLNGDGQGFDCDWSYGTSYEYNYSHHNEGGFMLVCLKNAIAAKVINNISYNDQRCLFMTSNVQEAHVEANLLYTGEHLETCIFSEHRGPGIYKENTFYKKGNQLEADWHKEINVYENNIYKGYSNTPEVDNRSIREEHLRCIEAIKERERVIEGIDVDNLECAMQSENQQRKIDRTEGLNVYGVEQFNLEQFSSYVKCYQKLIGYEKVLKENMVLEEDVKSYYEHNKELYYQNAEVGEVFAFKFVKDHIKYKLASHIK